MLVLSRKKDESILINHNITVTVVEIQEHKVRLGIVSPKDVPVHRREVFDVIHNLPKRDLPPVDTFKPSAEAFVVLDELASAITVRSKAQVNREMVLEAILQAVEAMEGTLAEAASLEHLKQLLLRRRH